MPLAALCTLAGVMVLVIGRKRQREQALKTAVVAD